MSFSAAATMRFDGTQHLGLFYGSGRVTEAEDLSFRFRTLEKDAFVVATRDSTSPDRLQITLGMLDRKKLPSFLLHKCVVFISKL